MKSPGTDERTDHPKAAGCDDGKISAEPAKHGDRVEIGRKKKHQAGDVKFTRLPNGNIAVTRDPDPDVVAAAIRRAKNKKAEARAPIGPERAAKLKARLRRRLEDLEE